MNRLRRAKHYCKLLLLMPFLFVALIPQGMMLSQSSPDEFEHILIICSANGVFHIPASELSSDIPKIPSIDSSNQQYDADIQDDSCPFSIANGNLLDTSTTVQVIHIALVQPKLFAAYQSQYKLRLHPASYPRGPPLSA